MSHLSTAELLSLGRWNTPTIYNGWEQITKSDAAHSCFNLEYCHDFMPNMGAMVGYAVTLQIQPGNINHRKQNPSALSEYRRYVASQEGPKIVVVQDLDKPECYGSFWGEVNSNVHRALGCLGTITDGAIRDLSEMTGVGFKAIARRLCVGHAYSYPVRWNCEVEVFGCKVKPGVLIHADQHGFLAIPEEDEKNLLSATLFMDNNECNTVITTARNHAGKSIEVVLEEIERATQDFRENIVNHFGKR